MKPAKSFLLYCFALLTGLTSLNAQAFYLFGSNWKEEVLLHDGSKIIVNRSQSHGGFHEFGQKPPVSEQAISFDLPGTHQTVEWEDKATPDVGSANFSLLQLDVLNGVPYLAVTIRGCLPYNKWGRPNPDYVFFKYVGGVWKQIPIEEYPAEFGTDANMMSETVSREQWLSDETSKSGYVSSALIKQMNAEIRTPQNRTITRTPIPGGGMGGCPNAIPDGHDGWIGLGFFNKSYEQCKGTCFAHDMNEQYCPCKKLYPDQQ